MVKGAPEQVLAHCAVAAGGARGAPHAGRAVRRRPPRGGRRQQAGAGPDRHHRRDESGLTLDGFLVFADEPKAAARDSLAQLARSAIEVKVATGDNPQVAEKVCADWV